MPFANPIERAIHFQKHGHEFGAGSETEYENLADVFMTGPLVLTMRECIRPNGNDRVRVNIANNHFAVGVVQSDIVKTYFIVPSIGYTGRAA
jgi:hypothetical protein